jgi:superfamily II DNA or RNA helicase
MSTQLPLREYQAAALDAVRSAWARGVQRPAVVAPTGAGKTVMFAHLIKDHLDRHARATTDPAFRFASRAVVLVHRDELADQAIDKINQVLHDPEIRVGKVKATDNDVAAHVVVASVQTLAQPGRIAQLLDPDGTDYAPIGLVVVDECHHAVAPSWRKVMDELGCFTKQRDDRSDPVMCVGFSATLARGDQVGLGSVWQEVAYAISLTRLIRRGHLADVRGVQVTVADLDLAGVRRSGGDYQTGDLGRAIEDSDATHAIAAAYQEYAADRPGVVFAPTVDSARNIAVDLDMAGFPSAVVAGETSREERQLIYKRYREGDLQILVNCMVLTEGFDAPWASCAVIARPTQSAPLYTQMVGRVLRPWPGKKDALVLDVVGMSGHHKLATLIDLAPGKVTTVRPDQTLAEAVEEAELAALADEEEREEYARQSRLTAKDVDLFAQSRSVWLRSRAGVWFIPTREGEFFLWPSTEPGLWDVCQAPMDGYRPLPWERLHAGLGLDLAMSWAQTEAEEADHSIASRTSSWRKKGGKASDAQKAMLQRYKEFVPSGVDWDQLPKVDASDYISIGKASRKFDKHYGRLG